MQNDLSPLCDIARKYGFIKLAGAADLKIRNAISHGRVNTEGHVNEIVFQSKIGSEQYVERIANYEFDRKLMQSLDVISGAFLSFCKVFGREIQSIQLEALEDDYVRLMVAGLGISNSEYRCVNASLANRDNEEQVNFVFAIGVSDDETAFRKAAEILLAVHSLFRNYKHYSISFQNDRLTGNIIRFKKEEIEQIEALNTAPHELARLIRCNKDTLWFGFGEEEVSAQQIKYFCFPEYESDAFSVRDVEDASLEDRKRLKGNVFIGEEDDREEIIRLGEKAIDWMKMLYNPPSLVMKIKHGSIEADCVFLNVYRDDSLRDNRALMQNNTNFVCQIEYCINPEFALKENRFIKYIYQNKDIEGCTTFLWREKRHTKNHIYANVGRNETCPCGSGKKYKKCHGVGA